MNDVEYIEYNATRVKNVLDTIEKNLDAYNYAVKFKFDYCPIKSSLDEDPAELVRKFYSNYQVNQKDFQIIDATYFKINFEHQCLWNYLTSEHDEDKLGTYFKQLLQATNDLGYFQTELFNFIQTTNCKIYKLMKNSPESFVYWDSLYVLVNNDLKLAAVLEGYGDN